MKPAFLLTLLLCSCDCKNPSTVDLDVNKIAMMKVDTNNMLVFALKNPSGGFTVYNVPKSLIKIEINP